MHPKYAPAYLHWYRTLQQQRWAEEVPAYRAVLEREQAARRGVANDNLLRAEPADLLPENSTERVGSRGSRRH